MMQRIVLVATPHLSFGELLRLSLEEAKNYHVYIALNASEALGFVHRITFDLAIIDIELQDEPVMSIVQAIRETAQVPKLVLIPPENDPDHPLINRLTPDGCLNRPFYLPGLLDIIDQLLQSSESNYSHQEEPSHKMTPLITETIAEPVNENLINDLLSDFLLNSYSSAAFITKNGKVLSFSGNISTQEAQSLSDMLVSYWCINSTYDLVRSVQLESREEKILFFATPLSYEFGLGLVNSIQNPISKVREEMHQFAEILKSPFVKSNNVEKGSMTSLQSADEGETPSEVIYLPENMWEDNEKNVPYQKTETLPLEAIRAIEQNMLREFPPDQSDTSLEHTRPLKISSEIDKLPANLWVENPDFLTEQVTSFDLEDEPDKIITCDDQNTDSESSSDENLEDLDIPVLPSQQGFPFFEDQQEDNLPTLSDFESKQPEIKNESQPESDIISPDQGIKEFESVASGPTVTPTENPENEIIKDTELSGDQIGIEEDIPIVFPWDENETLPFIPKNIAATQPILTADTIPIPAQSGKTFPLNIGCMQSPELRSAAEKLGILDLDNIDGSPGQNPTPYTCLLLTRIPSNRLRSDLAGDVKEWLTELFRSYHWKLDSIAVRPEYLQWTVRLLPSDSPACLVRIVRKVLSERILRKYPRMKPIDGSDDFWAPGYLIIHDSQPLSQKNLFEFIQLTRRRQGYIRN